MIYSPIAKNFVNFLMYYRPILIIFVFFLAVEGRISAEAEGAKFEDLPFSSDETFDFDQDSEADLNPTDSEATIDQAPQVLTDTKVKEKVKSLLGVLELVIPGKYLALEFSIQSPDGTGPFLNTEEWVDPRRGMPPLEVGNLIFLKSAIFLLAMERESTPSLF